MAIAWFLTALDNFYVGSAPGLITSGRDFANRMQSVA
jgi:hypothetical protein